MQIICSKCHWIFAAKLEVILGEAHCCLKRLVRTVFRAPESWFCNVNCTVPGNILNKCHEDKLYDLKPASMEQHYYVCFRQFAKVSLASLLLDADEQELVM